MARKPEIGNVQIYPQRPLRDSDKNGFVLKFYCPIKGKRIRKNCGTRDRREARRIQKDCQRRLLNGEYIATGGAITKQHAAQSHGPMPAQEELLTPNGMSWDDAAAKYRAYKRNRMRKQSYASMTSRIDMSARIFEARRANDQLPPGATLPECFSLEGMEYLQDRLRDGDEGRFENRQPSTVNSIVGDVLAFARYCYAHEWIEKIPPIRDLDEDEPMRGRSITGEEFDRMLAAVEPIVGSKAEPTWTFLLKILWESGMRVGESLAFSWDDKTKIHPVWAKRRENSTLVFPSTQKNRKAEEIPMLPGLRKLLETVPAGGRTGPVIKLVPIQYAVPGKKPTAFTPEPEDLAKLIVEYSNLAIANACQVSDPTVATWLKKLGLVRKDRITRYGQAVPPEVIAKLKKRRARRPSKSQNLSKDRVSRVISAIGEQAGIIVRQPDPARGLRVKFASAHDLRRSLADRLFNLGLSAETLMVIMRHQDFATTRKYYQARKRADSATSEINKLLGGESQNRELVGGLVGGKEKAPQLSAEELLKLKALLERL